MQIIQSGPSSATLRQAALNDSMGQIQAGLQGLEKQKQTKRMEALALSKQANDLREQGYDVTPEMVEASLQEKPGAIAKFFGAKDPEKVDLYGKRTQEYKDKQAAAAQERKYKMDGEILDRQFKRNQIEQTQADRLAKQEKERSELQVPGFGETRTAKEALDIRTAKADADEANEIIDQIKSLGTDVAVWDRQTIGKINQLKTVLAGKLRLPLTGPGAMTEDEFQRLVGNIGDPSNLFGTEENEMAKLDQLKDVLNKGIQSKFASSSAKPYKPTSGWNGGEEKMALQPASFRGQDPGVPFSPTSIPDMSPIQNAQAGNLKNIDDKSLLSRREQLLQKAKARR